MITDINYYTNKLRITTT